MEKILILITLIFLTSCTWNYKNGNIQKNIEAKEVQELENELLELEQQKAKETLEKIKLEDEIASEVLQNFLKSEDFDIKAEIEKTKLKYNDNLGPILEYEHEVIEEEEDDDTLTGSGETGTGKTLSGTIIDSEEVSDDTQVYSGEVTINDANENTEEGNEQPEENKEIIYNTQEKKGRSGTYTMYIGISDNCKGGLKMTDLEGNEKWLFENNCDKMIYNFELAVGGINVYYNDANGGDKNEYVTIK